MGIEWRKEKIHTGKKEREQKMKTKMKIMLALLTLGMLAFVASAQDNNDGPPGGGGPGGQGPGGPRGHHHPPPLPLVVALDVNHDGVIDAGEIANASAALKTLDKNGDGQLTTDEYLPKLPANAPKDAPRPPLPPIVKALDANGNGVIDANEIANAPAALKSLDKNGDGQLTRDEFCPRPNTNGGNEAGAPPEDAPSGPPPEQ